MDHHDVVGRQINALVGADDSRIVPLGNPAKKNSGECFRSKIQGAAHAGNVVSRDHCAEHGGEMQNADTVFGSESF